MSIHYKNNAIEQAIGVKLEISSVAHISNEALVELWVWVIRNEDLPLKFYQEADLKGRRLAVTEKEFEDDRQEWKEPNHYTIYIPRELHFAREMKREFNYGKQEVGRIRLSAGHFRKAEKKSAY